MIEELIIVGIGIIVGGYVVYNHMTIKSLKHDINIVAEAIGNFPSAEDLAKQVLRVKLPIEDLPPDLKKSFESFQGHQPKNKVPDEFEKKKMEYIG